MGLDLPVWERHQQPWRNQAGVQVIGTCAVWEPGGDVLSEDLSQGWWKMKRAEVLRVITLLLRLAPAEWNIFFMWFPLLLSSDQQLRAQFHSCGSSMLPGKLGGFWAFSKLEFSICAFSCSYTSSSRR